MPFELDVSDAETKDRRLVHAIADMTVPMGEAEKIIIKAIDHRFTEQTDGQSAWQPLAESTVEDRKRKGYGPTPILERTKTLRESMKGSHSRDSAEAGPSEDVGYAKYHLGEGKVVRDFLAMTEAEMLEVDEAIARHLEAAGG